MYVSSISAFVCVCCAFLSVWTVLFLYFFLSFISLWAVLPEIKIIVLIVYKIVDVHHMPEGQCIDSVVYCMELLPQQAAV